MDKAPTSHAYAWRAPKIGAQKILRRTNDNNNNNNNDDNDNDDNDNENDNDR